MEPGWLGPVRAEGAVGSVPGRKNGSHRELSGCAAFVSRLGVTAGWSCRSWAASIWSPCLIADYRGAGRSAWPRATRYGSPGRSWESIGLLARRGWRRGGAAAILREKEARVALAESAAACAPRRPGPAHYADPGVARGDRPRPGARPRGLGHVSALSRRPCAAGSVRRCASPARLTAGRRADPPPAHPRAGAQACRQYASLGRAGCISRPVPARAATQRGPWPRVSMRGTVQCRRRCITVRAGPSHVEPPRQPVTVVSPTSHVHLGQGPDGQRHAPSARRSRPQASAVVHLTPLTLVPLP